jgi:MoaA/NifB/PqqE/SkfB family radical SAM enzyme
MKQKTVHVGKGHHYPLFSLISLELGAQCNRTCVFCPNHDNVRPDTYLSRAVIEKVITELSVLRYAGRFEPFIYNEPLKDFTLLLWWITTSRARLPRAVLGLSTNGDYLKPHMIDQMFQAGLNQLTINIYSSKDGDPRPAVVTKGVERATKRAALIQRWLDERPYIDQRSSLYLRVPVRSCIAKVVHKYGVTPDGTNFGGGFGLSNRSGNVVWLQRAGAEPRTYSGMCVKPFRQLQINHRGDAILCCNDYHGVTTWGNVRQHSVLDLWNHMTLNRARAELQDGTRTGLCAGCDFNGGAYRHMITRVKL